MPVPLLLVTVMGPLLALAGTATESSLSLKRAATAVVVPAPVVKVTVLVPLLKFIPPMRRVSPTAGAGLLTLLIWGLLGRLPMAGVTVKWVVPEVPAAVVTVTLPVMAPEGTATIRAFLLAYMTLAVAAPANRTVLPEGRGLKPEPWI
ncbi:hypothetical protein D3C86_1180290 [compost metagenome]